MNMATDGEYLTLLGHSTDYGELDDIVERIIFLDSLISTYYDSVSIEDLEISQRMLKDEKNLLLLALGYPPGLGEYPPRIGGSTREVTVLKAEVLNDLIEGGRDEQHYVDVRPDEVIVGIGKMCIRNNYLSVETLEQDAIRIPTSAAP